MLFSMTYNFFNNLLIIRHEKNTKFIIKRYEKHYDIHKNLGKSFKLMTTYK